MGKAINYKEKDTQTWDRDLQNADGAKWRIMTNPNSQYFIIEWEAPYVGDIPGLRVRWSMRAKETQEFLEVLIMQVLPMFQASDQVYANFKIAPFADVQVMLTKGDVQVMIAGVRESLTYWRLG